MKYTGLNSNLSPLSQQQRRSHNFQTLRIVFITSLFWVFIDAFLILYLLDANKCPEQQIIYRDKADISDNERIIKQYNALKAENLYKFRTTVPETTHQFSTPNDRNNFLNKLKLWFKEKPSEHKNPSNWPGENGRPVQIPAHLKAESERRFKENQFNIVASDLIALNRSIPDQRSEAYVYKTYKSG